MVEYTMNGVGGNITTRPDIRIMALVLSPLIITLTPIAAPMGFG
jgi:hypothetical protein